VAALRGRLSKAGVKSSHYRASTIDGWAIRLITTFPKRAGDSTQLIAAQYPNYRKIREAAIALLKDGHIDDIIAASYDRMLVDEYQDCSIRQHCVVGYASNVLPTCVLGDTMQAIFGFGDDPLADWHKHVCEYFPAAGELKKPWRWINAEAEALGDWLLEVRRRLIAGEAIDLRAAPAAVSWVQLDGSADDHLRRLKAGRINSPTPHGSILIIGSSTSPASQQKYASQTPGAVTVEAVNLTDLINFARDLDPCSPSAVTHTAEFAQKIMTNVGAADLAKRVTSLLQGTARKDPSDVEAAALALSRNQTHKHVLDLLVAINRDAGVHVFRPAVLRACIDALQISIRGAGITFYEAAVRIREQYRLQGRILPKRAESFTRLTLS
jgi:DNA helicase-2/ATP-dependent DNA helicase PcrA